MNVLDLFSGIGGFSLGLERAGMRTVAFCERSEHLRQLLAERWPGVPIHDDVTTLDGLQYRGVDLVCGGFPCQPVSHAGKRMGAGDDRWLWPEMRRIIQESNPSWVIGENVAGLDGLGLDEAIDDLEADGYEVAPPLEIPAYAVGADHERIRIWIVAHSERNRLQRREIEAQGGRANGERNNYQDFCSLALGMRYPLPEFGEQIMGYPLGWTFAEIWRSETPSSRKSPKSSAGQSCKQKPHE